jgi:CRP/FNR family transcriptional regulator
LLTKIQDDQVMRVFPILAEISSEEWEASEPVMRNFAAKTVVFNAVDFEQYSIFIIQGKVRITNLGENGRATAMNQISDGDVCSLMVLSTMSQREYLGFMTSETSVLAVFLKKSYFLKWIGIYPNFRKFIFDNILNGFVHLTGLIHNVLFQRLDLRLANFLIEKTSVSQPVLRMTQEEVAIELGTAREVVSRIFKRFKEEGYIQAGRGYLRVVHRSKLENLENG